MKPTHVLVKFNDSWEDEYDVYGMKLFSHKEWLEYLETCSKFFDKNSSYTLDVSRNNSIEYSSFKELVQMFSVTPITELEFKSMLNAFSHIPQFGYFPQMRVN